MKRSLQIRFDGIEPILIIKKEEPRHKSTTEIAAFYIFRKFGRKIGNMLIWIKLRKAGFEPIRCEGCGNGWAVWAIDNPNYNTKDSWFVCDGCVNFYDWKITRRVLPQKRK